MSKQTLSIEQMQHLKELGVDTSKASAYWYRIVQHRGELPPRVISDWKLTFSLDIAYCTGHTLESVPAFTLDDVVEMLPKVIDDYCLYIEWECGFISYQYDEGYEGMKCFRATEIKDNLIDTAYEMLCWVIENGYLKV